MANSKINYLEIPAKDLVATKQFFTEVFDWNFVDYGPDYCAFENAGIDGGFYKSDEIVNVSNGSVLIVFHTKSLKKIMDKITNNYGEIVKDIFSFPGGYRFHFSDPNGNEFAVWSEENN